MITFQDITVAPFAYRTLSWSRPDRKGALHQGGPIWPDWDNQVGPRFCREGAPFDDRPDDPDPPVAISPVAEVSWCGPVHGHYGHMVADFGMRIIPSMTYRPETPLLFSIPPPRLQALAAMPRSRRFAKTPKFFREILAYAGARPKDVVISVAPELFRTLHVHPQPEQLYVIGPSPDHLALMGAHARRKLGPLQQGGAVFVSRAGMSARFAGESYLEQVLAAAGMRIFRPEQHSVTDQIRTYRAADTLVFSEGSAVHTLQFLGGGLGTVVVLERRPGNRIAEASLQPRCRHLAYVDMLRDTLCETHPDGQAAVTRGMPFLDPGILLAEMAALGFDLSGVWQSSALRDAEEADVAAWLREPYRDRFRDDPNSRAHIAAVLQRNGMSELGPVPGAGDSPG